MLNVTTSAATASQSQALKLLQISAQGVWGVAAQSAGSGTSARVHAGPNADAFISAIMNILLDAQGNANVSILAKDGFASAQTGDGDDTITMDVHNATNVSSGKGNDSIAIRTYAMSEAARAYYPEGTSEVAAVHNVDSGSGNDTISIDTHGNAHNVYAGDGNDVIAITSTMAPPKDDGNRPYLIRAAVDNIDAGAGDDTVFIEAEGKVDRIDAGAGDDTVFIEAEGKVDRIEAGAGDDTVVIEAEGWVDRIYGGAGDDTVVIETEGMVTRVDGGSGNDTFNVSGDSVAGLMGGEGDDTIQVAADRQVNGIWGDDGNDTIEVTASSISGISGGKGDDTIILNATAANAVAHIHLNVGDGHDAVHVNSALAIERSVGVNKLFDMSKAIIERTDEATVKITFDDADDSVTVHLTGDMVGKPLAFDFHESGRLVIRRDDADAPQLAQFPNPYNPVVLTRYA